MSEISEDSGSAAEGSVDSLIFRSHADEMKLNTSLLFAAGICAAFALGVFSSRTPSVEPLPERSPSSGLAAQGQRQLSQATGASDEAGAREALAKLRIAHQQLEKELEAVNERLVAAKIGAERYEVIRRKLIEDGGLDANINMNDASVPEQLFEVLNFDEETRRRVNEASGRILDEIRGWEAESAVLQETSDDTVVYRIPASTADYAAHFDEMLSDFLPPADRELLTSLFEKDSARLTDAREVSLTLLDTGDPNHIRHTLSIKSIEADGRPRWTSSSTGSYSIDRPIKIDRWSHLFSVE